MKKCSHCEGWKKCPLYDNDFCNPQKRRKAKTVKVYSAYIWRKIKYLGEEKWFQYNAGFCFNDFSCIERYFNDSCYIIEGIAIKDRIRGKIIYRGRNYAEMKSAIKSYLEEKKKTLMEVINGK